MAKISVEQNPIMTIQMNLEEAANITAVLGMVSGGANRTDLIFNQLMDVLEAYDVEMPHLTGKVEFNGKS